MLFRSQGIEDVTAYIDSELRQLRAGYESGSLGYSRTCRYCVLGAMWMDLRMFGVFDEVRTTPSKHSVAAIYRALREAPPTGVYSKNQRGGRLCCGLGDIVRPLVEGIEHRLGPEIKKVVGDCSYAAID